MNLAPFAPYLSVVLIILSVVLVVMVVIQAKGNDMSAFMVGDPSSSFRTKRGLELTLHRWTIYLSVIFFVVTFFTFIAMGQAVAPVAG
jgi:preprotein translocase subunit SecG